MKLTWLGIACLVLSQTSATAREDPAAAVAGVYQPVDKKMLSSTFVRAVR